MKKRVALCIPPSREPGWVKTGRAGGVNMALEHPRRTQATAVCLRRGGRPRYRPREASPWGAKQGGTTVDPSLAVWRGTFFHEEEKTMCKDCEKKTFYITTPIYYPSD